MKNIFCCFFLIIIVACGRVADAPLAEEDAELAALLDKIDSCRATGDHEKCYSLYAEISAEYEQKNLTDLQKHYQELMLSEAKAVREDNRGRGNALMGEAYQQLATSYMVEQQLDSALLMARKAYNTAPQDTLDFRSQTLLIMAQVFLAEGIGDSVTYYINEAERIYPAVAHTDLYRITRAYGLDIQGRSNELMEVLPRYITESGIHAKAELTRLLMSCHEEDGQWREAYEDAGRLMHYTDSIAADETSENMARIHALQHERMMEHQRAESETERARLCAIISIVLLLMLAATAAGLFYRRKARIAHANELEAMRLSELAQSSENVVREENFRLQRLYYEHLFAIILPILNTHRGKSGHINLEESSWELIEKNTDMVVPQFTSRLRSQHPTLTVEDVRFCCLLIMRVPNALLADIYGIAPASVAMRKQRMKKKLDSDVLDQTIENYLNQYLTD